MQHRTPGNLRAFYQIKMRNVRNGKVAENRFRPGEEMRSCVLKPKKCNSSTTTVIASCVWITKLSTRSTSAKNCLVNLVNHIKEVVTFLIKISENGTLAITAEPPSQCCNGSAIH